MLWNARSSASAPRLSPSGSRLSRSPAIVTRKSFAEVPPRVEYTLTEMGWDLIPLIEHMREYGTKWLGDGRPAVAETPEQVCARGVT